jgi:hypothetical protein
MKGRTQAPAGSAARLAICSGWRSISCSVCGSVSSSSVPASTRSFPTRPRTPCPVSSFHVTRCRSVPRSCYDESEFLGKVTLFAVRRNTATPFRAVGVTTPCNQYCAPNNPRECRSLRRPRRRNVSRDMYAGRFSSPGRDSRRGYGPERWSFQDGTGGDSIALNITRFGRISEEAREAR